MSTTPDLLGEQAELDALLNELKGLGEFAFDTEFIRDETYDAILCLIQVATPKWTRLIDPAGGLDVGGFWKLVCDARVLKIVHAGKEDFEVALRASGQPPRNVFDVQIAAGFVGYGYPLSLSRLVSATTGKRLSKEQTRTDWLRRPLTDDQVAYAIDDVKYLPRIHAKLKQALEQRGRTAWAAEEMARFEDPGLYGPRADRVVRVKGSARLDPVGLAALERLLTWRDEWAKAKNRPVRALMRDDVLVEIARRRPTKASDLEVLRGFHQARNGRLVQEILELVAQAEAVPKDELPELSSPPRDEPPLERAVLEILSSCTRAICHEEGVAMDLVGSVQRFRELMGYLASGSQGALPGLLAGWRGEFIGRRLADLLHGRGELHFSGWPESPRIDIVASWSGDEQAATK